MKWEELSTLFIMKPLWLHLLMLTNNKWSNVKFSFVQKLGNLFRLYINILAYQKAAETSSCKQYCLSEYELRLFRQPFVIQHSDMHEVLDTISELSLAHISFEKLWRCNFPMVPKRVQAISTSGFYLAANYCSSQVHVFPDFLLCIEKPHFPHHMLRCVFQLLFKNRVP